MQMMMVLRWLQLYMCMVVVSFRLMLLVLMRLRIVVLCMFFLNSSSVQEVSSGVVCGRMLYWMICCFDVLIVFMVMMGLWLICFMVLVKILLIELMDLSVMVRMFVNGLSLIVEMNISVKIRLGIEWMMFMIYCVGQYSYFGVSVEVVLNVMIRDSMVLRIVLMMVIWNVLSSNVRIVLILEKFGGNRWERNLFMLIVFLLSFMKLNWVLLNDQSSRRNVMGRLIRKWVCGIWKVFLRWVCFVGLSCG